MRAEKFFRRAAKLDEKVWVERVRGVQCACKEKSSANNETQSTSRCSFEKKYLTVRNLGSPTFKID